MNPSLMALDIGWRIEELNERVRKLKLEMNRLLDLKDVGDGGHNWDRKMLALWERLV
jgi:hypothetical protein